jgi:hypothetical protein
MPGILAPVFWNRSYFNQAFAPKSWLMQQFGGYAKGSAIAPQLLSCSISKPTLGSMIFSFIIGKSPLKSVPLL